MRTDHTSEAFRKDGVDETALGTATSDLASGQGEEARSEDSSTCRRDQVGDGSSPQKKTPEPAVRRSRPLQTPRRATQSFPIEFRVVREGSPTRRLRLTGQRYTFGSGQGCTIRLNDRSLRPMHAVLIRDQTRLVLRAYSIPIQVNGTRRTEAELLPGDIVQMGQYRMELLATPDFVSEGARESHRWSSALDPAQDGQGQSADARFLDPLPSVGETQFLQPLSAAEEAACRERLRDDLERWRARQIECDLREHRCEEREAHLRGRESELWTRAESLHRRESRLQSQEAAAAQLFEEFARRQQELFRLRDEAQSRASSLATCDSEVEPQQQEYQRQLEETQARLRESQAQAEAATEAVQRMREQFDALNEQLAELSQDQLEHDQEVVSRGDQEHRAQQECRLAELETARDEAIEAKAESEGRRLDAEARVSEMSAQLESLGNVSESELVRQREKIQDSEALIQQLRTEVAELQQTLQQTSEESVQLRRDHDQARQSVQQLESLIEQNTARSESERESWSMEADQLRASIDELSLELAGANNQLSELRKTNQELVQRIEQLKRERDDLIDAVDERPTRNAYESLQQELDTTHQKLEEITQQYEATLGHVETPSDQGTSCQKPQAKTLVAGAPADDTMGDDATAEEATAAESTAAESTATEFTANEAGDDEQASPHASDDGFIWPDDPIESPPALETAVWNDATDSESDETWPDDASEQSGMMFDRSTSTRASSIDTEAASLWPDCDDEPTIEDHAEVDQLWPSLLDNPSLESSSLESPAGFETADDDHVPSHERDARSESSSFDELPFGERSTPEEHPYLEPASGLRDWDQEHCEELIASEWENNPEGYRVDQASLESSETDATELAFEFDESSGEDDDDNRDDSDQGPGPPGASGSRGDAADSEAANDAQSWWHADEPDSESRYLREASSLGEASSESGSDWGPLGETLEQDDQVSDAEDEGSIEAYMNRLLQLAQGESPHRDSIQRDSAEQPGSCGEESNVVADSTFDASDDSQDESSESELEATYETASLNESWSPGPEKSEDLSAPQESGHRSVRSVDSRSVRMQTRDTQIKGMLRFACAAVALVCGGGCFLFVPGVTRFVAVAMTVIVAAIYVREGLLAMLDAHQRLQAAEGERVYRISEEKAVPA